MESSNIRYQAEGGEKEKSTWKYQLIIQPNNKFVLNFNLCSWNGADNFEDRAINDWIYEGDFICSKYGESYILAFSNIYKSGTSQAPKTEPEPIATEQYTKGMKARISQNGKCEFKKENWVVNMNGSTNVKEFFDTHYANMQTSFEMYVSKLLESEKYPFDYSVRYNLNNDPYCHYSNCLILNPNGTFSAGYLILKREGNSSSIEYKAEGNFSYNVASRVLTLTRVIYQIEKCYYDKYKEKVEKTTIVSDIIEKNYPVTMEIPNFTWISSTINWPVIRLMDGDVEVNLSDTVIADAFYYGTVPFEALCDKIKTASSLTNFASTISTPICYDDTTLNPDGTFSSDSSTSSWDRDMPTYCWDSYVNLKGNWNYDSINRVLTLTYNSFKLNDDGKVIDPSQFNLFPGKTLVNNDFYFESNFIFGIHVGFYYSTPCISENWIKKKI